MVYLLISYLLSIPINCCISYSSITVIKYHGHDNLQQGAFAWLYSCRGSGWLGRHKSQQQPWEEEKKAETWHPQPQIGRKRRELEMEQDDILSKAAPINVLPLARLHLLIHQPETSLGNISHWTTMIIYNIC